MMGVLRVMWDMATVPCDDGRVASDVGHGADRQPFHAMMGVLRVMWDMAQIDAWTHARCIMHVNMLHGHGVCSVHE
jgi:hypothetical protein